MYKCNFKECQYNSESKAALNTSLIFKPCACYEVFYCSSDCMQKDKNYHKCPKSAGGQQKAALNYTPLAEDSLNNSTNSTTKKAQKCLDDYEFINLPKKTNGELGKGAFGEVKLVKEIATGKLFALKQINKKNLKLKGYIDQMKKEIKLQKKLNHPHVLKFYHKFEDISYVYFILEYVEKGTVFQHMKKKRSMSEDEAFYFFIQTCLAVDYIHQQGIIHRDIKPENLLLDANGNIKLCDFGWSTQFTDQRSTQCGTPDYMCPEILKFEQHDLTVDIWSLGILLFELLNGFAPFSRLGSQSVKMLDEMKRQEKEGILFVKQVSPEVKDLITKILQMDSKKRLTCKQIFSHQWTEAMLKKQNWKIEKGVLAPASSSSDTNRELTPEKKKPGFNDLFDKSPSSTPIRSGSPSMVSAISTQQINQNKTDSNNSNRISNLQQNHPPPQRSTSQIFQKSQLDMTSNSNRSASPIHTPAQQHSNLFQKAAETSAQKVNDTQVNDNSLLDLSGISRINNPEQGSRSPHRKPIFQTENKDNSIIAQRYSQTPQDTRGRQPNTLPPADESTRKSANRIFQPSPARSNTPTLTGGTVTNTNNSPFAQTTIPPPLSINPNNTSNISDISGSKSPLRKKIFEKSPIKEENKEPAAPSSTSPYHYTPVLLTGNTKNEQSSPLYKSPNSQISTTPSSTSNAMAQNSLISKPSSYPIKSAAAAGFDPSQQKQKFELQNNVNEDDTLNLSLSSLPNDASMISEKSMLFQTTLALGNYATSNKQAAGNILPNQQQSLISKYLDKPRLSRPAKQIDFTQNDLANQALMSEFMEKLKREHRGELANIEKRMEELKKENESLKDCSLVYANEQLEQNRMQEAALKKQVQDIQQQQKQQLNEYKNMEKDLSSKQDYMGKEYKQKQIELQKQQAKLESEYMKLEEQQSQQTSLWKKQLDDQQAKLQKEYDKKQKEMQQELDRKQKQFEEKWKSKEGGGQNDDSKFEQSFLNLQTEQESKLSQLRKEYLEKEKELNRKQSVLANEQKRIEQQQKEEQQKLKKQLEQRTQELEREYETKFESMKEELDLKFEQTLKQMEEKESRRKKETDLQQRNGIEKVQELEASFIKMEKNYVEREETLKQDWKRKQDEFDKEQREMKKRLDKVQRDQQERQLLWEKQLSESHKKQKEIVGDQGSFIQNTELVEEMREQQRVLREEQNNFIQEWEKQQEERANEMIEQQERVFKEMKKDYQKRSNELEERLKQQREEYQEMLQLNDLQEEQNSKIDIIQQNYVTLEKEIRTKYIDKQKLFEESQKQVISKYEQLENQQRQQRDSLKKQFSSVMEEIQKNYENQQKKLKEELDKKHKQLESKLKDKQSSGQGSTSNELLIQKQQAEEQCSILQENLQEIQEQQMKQIKKLEEDYKKKQAELEKQQADLKIKTKNLEKGQEGLMQKWQKGLSEKSNELEQEYETKHRQLKEEMEKRQLEFEKKAKERESTRRKDYEEKMREREEEIDRLREEAIENCNETSFMTSNRKVDEDYAKKQKDLENQYKKLQEYCQGLEKKQQSALSQYEDKMQSEIRKIQAEYFKKQLELQKEMKSKQIEVRESIRNGKKKIISKPKSDEDDENDSDEEELRNLEKEADRKREELENQYKEKQEKIIHSNQEIINKLKGFSKQTQSKNESKKAPPNKNNAKPPSSAKKSSLLKDLSSDDSSDEDNNTNNKQPSQQNSRSLSKESAPPKSPLNKKKHKRTSSEVETQELELPNLNEAQNPNELKKMLSKAQEKINKLNSSLQQQQDLSSTMNKTYMADLSMESNQSKLRRMYKNKPFQPREEEREDEFYDPMSGRTYLESSMISNKSLNQSKISQRKLDLLNESLLRRQARENNSDQSYISTISEDSSRILRHKKARVEIEQQVPPKIEELGFFERIKFVFGCGSRR